MKIRIMTVAMQTKKFRKGLYLMWGREILAGPYKTPKQAFAAKGEWYVPGERLSFY